MQPQMATSRRGQSLRYISQYTASLRLCLCWSLPRWLLHTLCELATMVRNWLWLLCHSIHSWIHLRRSLHRRCLSLRWRLSCASSTGASLWWHRGGGGCRCRSHIRESWLLLLRLSPLFLVRQLCCSSVTAINMEYKRLRFQVLEELAGNGVLHNTLLEVELRVTVVTWNTGHLVRSVIHEVAEFYSHIICEFLRQAFCPAHFDH
mmetsp:Transcript_33352/g.74299  ORF Transcript_33352/g.74299 Transcript_33352/m.74299 type:complete len:205 (-) Transcript_33352:2816-3430(-)